ncbi:MAG: cyclic nucleotide-binding domain-containing protein [Deltaproteobacteria bacterium]|nr:cyclic nucleotide-binding domain-containing protein [Deltaproteobacteria bacterium]MBI3295595.1 cyclic nucleotide-binding domain-containing protein [Deltaproteobacteria bacterium]
MFENLPILSQLSPEHQKAITSLARVEKVAAGSLLTQEGQSGDELFALLEGEAVIELINPKKGVRAPVSTLRSGELFGEMVLLGRKRRVATVRANSAVTIAIWPADKLFQLFEKQSIIGYRFMMALACELADRLEGSNRVLRTAAG